MGPGRVIDSIRPAAAAGFTSRNDFYWALHACCVNRPEHRTVFAQIFRLYWRDPRYLEHMMSLLLPAVRGVQEERAASPGDRRRGSRSVSGGGRASPGDSRTDAQRASVSPCAAAGAGAYGPGRGSPAAG